MREKELSFFILIVGRGRRTRSSLCPYPNSTGSTYPQTQLVPTTNNTWHTSLILDQNVSSHLFIYLLKRKKLEKLLVLNRQANYILCAFAGASALSLPCVLIRQVRVSKIHNLNFRGCLPFNLKRRFCVQLNSTI